VLTDLRHGNDSEEWKNALRFADEFVWSSLPKTTEAEKTRLRALLPQLEKTLKHGLGTVAYHEGDVRLLMQELSRFYQGLLNGEAFEVKTAEVVIAENAASEQLAEAEKATVTGEPPVPPVNQSPVEEIILSSGSIEAEPEESPASGDEFVEAAQQMKVGNWIE